MRLFWVRQSRDFDSLILLHLLSYQVLANVNAYYRAVLRNCSAIISQSQQGAKYANPTHMALDLDQHDPSFLDSFVSYYLGCCYRYSYDKNQENCGCRRNILKEQITTLKCCLDGPRSTQRHGDWLGAKWHIVIVSVSCYHLCNILLFPFVL